MARGRVTRPSAAMVVATLALIVAMGGTGYAAFTLPKNSVGTSQLRDGAEEALDQGLGGRDLRPSACAGLVEQCHERVRRLKGTEGLGTARTAQDVLSEPVGLRLGQLPQRQALEFAGARAGKRPGHGDSQSTRIHPPHDSSRRRPL